MFIITQRIKYLEKYLTKYKLCFKKCPFEYCSIIYDISISSTKFSIEKFLKHLVVLGLKI